MALLLCYFLALRALCVLSPIDFNDDDANVWNSDDDGNLDDVDVDSSSTLRPIVSLKSATTISGGNGTASNPFIVN